MCLYDKFDVSSYSNKLLSKINKDFTYLNSKYDSFVAMFAKVTVRAVLIFLHCSELVDPSKI